jgi:predicted alpha/beta hydrolase family esterase
MNYLILAGIYNSGPEHWQSLWLKSDPRFHKLDHTSWDHPDRSVWVAELEDCVLTLGPETVLVAHSLACLMVVHWAALSKLRVRGALMVSVPDPQGKNFPSDAKNFGELPLVRLPFPSTVVSSDNDPYGTREHMTKCAKAWGSKLVAVSGLGHINADSGLGAWPEGRSILEKNAA